MAVRRCEQVTFLGYTVLSGGGIRVADKSINRLNDKVREVTKRNHGVPFRQLLDELNAVIRGWSNYFQLANRWLSNLRDINAWIRRKLRCYRLKQCGRKYTTYKYPVKPWGEREEKLECGHIQPGMVEYVSQDCRFPKHEPKVICQRRLAFSISENELGKVIETALVREYAGG